MIARDADAIEPWHVFGRVLEDVGNDAHRGFRWVDIGITHHELFKNIVLNSAGEFCRVDPLLFSGYDIQGHDRQHRTIHCHRHAHLIQWYLIEQDLHIQY